MGWKVFHMGIEKFDIIEKFGILRYISGIRQYG